jgi:hypothetical protein
MWQSSHFVIWAHAKWVSIQKEIFESSIDMGFLAGAGEKESEAVAALWCFVLDQLYLNLLRHLMHPNTSVTARTIVGGDSGFSSRTSCHSIRGVRLHNAYANPQYFAKIQILGIVPNLRSVGIVDCVRQCAILLTKAFPDWIRRRLKSAPEERRLLWKKVKRSANQTTDAIVDVYLNMSNASKKKTGHQSARPASETVSTSVRYNPQRYQS